MSKGLIDLKRANTPPANPLTVPETTPELITEPANTNEQVSPAPVLETAVIQSAQTERVSTIGARIPESLHQAIKLFCIANRLEMQHFVQDALSEHLKRLQSTDQS